MQTYSHYNRNALALLGGLIRSARKEHSFTEREIAVRAGISRGLLQRIERGDPKCSIGAAFEVATLVGVQLFDAEPHTLKRYLHQTEDKLTLLPESIRKKSVDIYDDF